jgi:hypothetical protein
MSLEKIIRPFQNGEVFNARRLPPSVAPVREVPERALLNWECPHSGAYVSGPEPGTYGFTVKWEEDESRRKTEKVRVENKDDPEQFIELERIKKMVLVKNTTKEEIAIEPKWELSQ